MSDCSDWTSGRVAEVKRDSRERAEVGDVQDDSSPAAMRASRPIPVELCKPTRAVPPLPPTASCQHKTGKLQASKLQRERDRKGRTRQGRSGPEVATG